MRDGGISLVGAGSRTPAHRFQKEKWRADRLAALCLLPLVLPLLALLWPVCLIAQGRPFLHASRRAGRNGRPFTLWKIRSMSPAEGDERILGGVGRDRVTPIGRFLRRTRLDELPQIINVLAGDIGFIGPRPPLVAAWNAFPDDYAEILKDRPGITGLATVHLCRREDRLLSRIDDPERLHNIYRRRCLPPKRRLDRLYRRRASAGLAAYVLIMTLWRNPRGGRRLRRLARISLRASRG
ncbi:sugar transferase [Alphaproteobacteria bacterium GH1-50]|uniref:Sugar transferase n=1 Tax=Kangsaoukella pontilimi TaxID=2691042 RepID=A0A7C9MFV4_9RHOB|nr:sugar transferase [Kangsaoukella pontilimi]MXQ09132.1 sugar transferase [Kangsaoukella pontilimi]